MGGDLFLSQGSELNQYLTFSPVTSSKAQGGGGRQQIEAVGIAETARWEEKTSSWWPLCLFHKTFPLPGVPGPGEFFPPDPVGRKHPAGLLLDRAQDEESQEL